MFPKNCIVELREGGDVRAAVVLDDAKGRLRLLTPEGREVRVPSERVVHDTGFALPETADTASLVRSLKDWEEDARRRAADVDLAELHGFLLEESSRDPAFDAEGISLSDLAALSLRDETPVARAAVHRALAAPNPFFQFNGRRWRMRSPEQAAKEEERLASARRLADERAAFREAAVRRLAGASADLPPGSGKFVRALRDLALFGEASKAKREAVETLADLHRGGSTPPATAEAAFDVLVRLGVFGRDENLALLRAGIEASFPPDVLEEAEQVARRPVTLAGRLDLRAMPLVTIDDATTTEIDDGLSFEPTPQGFRLGVHVADPAHFIDVGSKVDQVAAERATSYYVPGHAIPMLPDVLAEDAASLVEGQDRPAISVLVDMDADGVVLRSEVQPSVVRVTKRMTYEECEAALAGGESVAPWLPRVGELGRRLEAARREAGATPIRAPEVAIDFDEAGEPLISLVDPGRPARQLVSEMMILANCVVAEWMKTRGLPAIYRKQAKADPGVQPPPLDRYDPVAVNRYRRAIQRTEVSLEPGFHSGLGVASYLQATSPIRRYQDLVVHRILKAAIAGGPLPYTREQVAALAVATEQAGRQARQVEAETDTYWILRHLEKRVGTVLSAVVLRTDGRRTFVELLDFAHVTPIAPRPDHAPGKTLQLRVRVVKPRAGTLTLEEVSGGG